MGLRLVKDLDEKQQTMVNQILDYIKATTENLCNELDEIFLESSDRFPSLNPFEIKFYLDISNLKKEEKIEYLKNLKKKLVNMLNCSSVRIKVASKFHPMCWCYYLSKFFKSKVLDNYIMYGFCVPFYPGKPVLLAPYVFDQGLNEVKDILVHELTHSLMNSKDLNANNYKDAINDAWTLCFLY